MMVNKLYGFIFLLFFSTFTSATTSTPLELNNQISQLLLAPNATFFKQKNDFTSIENLLSQPFAPLTKADINQGFTEEIFWIKVTLSNPSDDDLRWVMSHETSYIDVMTIYYRDHNTSWQQYETSDHQPFTQRSIAYRKLNFAHTTQAKKTTDILIKLQMIDKDALTLAVNLLSEDVFNNTLADEQFFYGLYFGISLALVLITLIFALKLRQPLYFSYAFYLTMHLVFWGYLTGHIFQYLLPESPMLFNQGFNIVFLLFFISAVQFSKTFLNTATYCPTIHRILNAIQVFALFAICLRFAGVYGLVVHISHALLASLIMLPLIGWLVFRKGLKYARWYIFAWLLYGIGIVMSVLSASTSVFDWGVEPILYTQVLSLLESFLLMLAMADKVNSVNRELILVTQEAHQDFLTKLGNRRFLQFKFEQICNAQITSNTAKKYWCLVLDIDDFKQLNDNYGHAFGDQVLKQLATIFNQTCRPEDLVTRYGGEEFVILIETPDIDVVKHIAERIRLSVENAVFRHENKNIHTTISIGIAPLSYGKNTPFDLSFKNADKALYQVKNEDKNGIALCQNSTITSLTH